MASDPKIAALLRSIDVEEQRLYEERSRIQSVVDEREERFREVDERCRSIRDRLAQGAVRFRAREIGEGRIASLADWERFSKRLERELESLSSSFERAQAELRSGQQRLADIDEEIVEVRLERKRVERIVENRQERERVKNQALDEVSTEDLSIYKHRK